MVLRHGDNLDHNGTLVDMHDPCEPGCLRGHARCVRHWTGHLPYCVHVADGTPGWAELVDRLSAAGPGPTVAERRAAKPRGPLGTKLYSQPGVG
jgi:hypothetical protein